MKTFYWVLGIIFLTFISYYAFYAGWFLLRIFIGLMFITIFSFAFWLGTKSTKNNEK